MNHTTENICSSTQSAIDFFLDGELGSRELAVVSEHLRACSVCSGVVAKRRGLKQRLREAARKTIAPAHLDLQIRRNLTSPVRERHYRWAGLAVAAVLLAATGVTMSWRTGGLGFTPSSQEAYISSIASQAAPVMQIGLKQHVHCAVLKKMPSPPLTMGEMAQSLGKSYKDLLPGFQSHLPANFRVAQAHLCHYHGRYYTHIAATDGRKLISLLITNRAQGEAFETDLRAVAEGAGAGLYASTVQRFSLAAFETRDHLVYLVSDLDGGENLATLKSMTPDMDRIIRRLEI